MNKTKIKQLEREIKLLKEYKELLERCIELKNQLLNLNNNYIIDTTTNNCPYTYTLSYIDNKIEYV